MINTQIVIACERNTAFNFNLVDHKCLYSLNEKNSCVKLHLFFLFSFNIRFFEYFQKQMRENRRQDNEKKIERNVTKYYN